MAFPTLTRNPLAIEIEREENVLESQFEAGYQHKRKKFTKTRKLFKVSYDPLPTTDRDAIVTHFDTVGQFTTFSWTDNESNTHTVFYAKPIKFRRLVPGWFTFEPLEFKER